MTNPEDQAVVEIHHEASKNAVVVSQAVAKAAAGLSLTGQDLAHTLNVPEATVSGFRTGAHLLQPGSPPFDTAIRLVRIYREPDTIMSGDDAALQSWINAESVALGGVPRALTQTPQGLTATLHYLEARR
jgi:hypothetical protein